MQNRESEERERKAEEEKWAYPSTLLLAGQFGESRRKILLSVNKT